MATRYIALQVVMLPKDANPIPTQMPGFGDSLHYGTIFGGVILSYLDMAGAIAARREVALAGGSTSLALVTVALNRVEFKHPVFVGDVVRFETSLVRFGRTSVTISINVVAERAAQELHVTDAEAVYVGVDPSSKERRPVPLLQKN